MCTTLNPYQAGLDLNISQYSSTNISPYRLWVKKLVLGNTEDPIEM